MTNYNDADLEQMLGDLESDLVERKETFRGDAPDKVREAVCAFANDLPDHRKAGVVFIGAHDDGTPPGLAVTDELLRAVSDVKIDGNILPPPTLTVGRRTLRGAPLIVVSVEPADSPPVKYRGRVWIRTGPRRGIATAQDERILSEKRRYHDRPFDARPLPGATLAELSRLFFEEAYLPAAFARDVLDANDRSYEQRLAATKMVTSAAEATPTVLGILVLGTGVRDHLPGAYIQFLRIAGRSLSDAVVDEQVVGGTVNDVLRRIDDKLAAHNRTAVEFTQAATEQRRSLYPMAALQQLVRNAVLHRTYEGTNAPVRVTWFDDRIEIINPGGPFGAVTLENFGEPGVTDYRNPNLAESLRVLGFVQRFGAGIALARQTLSQNGNPPPEFTIQPTYVLVSVRAAA